MTRDAIIIGAGHNGLVAACYLAKAGLKPLVLERRATVGGAFTTAEFHPGFRSAIFAHAGGELRPSIARDLQIERFGALVVRPDPYVFALTPEGRGLPLYRDPSRTGRELQGFSIQDAARYPEFHGTVTRIARALDPLLSLTPPSLDQARVSEWWPYFGVGRALRALERRDAYRLMRWTTMPVADLVGEWFDADLVRAILAAPALVGTFAGPRSPGTGALMVLHAILDGHVGGTGSFVHGGPGALSAALAAAAVRMGAEIRTDAAVARIDVRDGAASGVTLETGETISCRTVVSNADPRRTLLGLVDPEHLDPAVRHAFSRVRCRGATAKINLALSGLPRFAAVDAVAGSSDPEAASRSFLSGRLHIGPGIDYLERAFDAAKYGQISPRPHLDVTIPSLTDASLAPAGAHVASVCAQFAPYHLRAGDWDARRDELSSVVIKTLEEYAPNLRRLIVGCQVLTPLDLERELGMTGGQIYHGEPALDQLFATRPVFGWARYRTPIAGLYLCGAGTHPGPGTAGACGANASREILRDLRRT